MAISIPSQVFDYAKAALLVIQLLRFLLLKNTRSDPESLPLLQQQPTSSLHALRPLNILVLLTISLSLTLKIFKISHDSLVSCIDDPLIPILMTFTCWLLATYYLFAAPTTLNSLSSFFKLALFLEFVQLIEWLIVIVYAGMINT
jgi:hypothetical protein